MTTTSDISILIDDNAGFSSPTTVNASSVNPLEATFSGLSINTGDYITFELAVNKAITQTPAGLDLEQELRFAFEANSINQADGTNVSTWTNEGQNTLDALTQTNSPSLVKDFMNDQDFVEFDGTNNESFEIADNADINVGGEPWEQRSYSLVFQTGTDISSRQVIYEEGGTTRGVAIYVFNNQLYFGAYNENNDGSGSPWNFTSVSTPVSPSTTYVMTNVFLGNSSSTGTLETYLNGESVGTASGVGFLYDHGANISIGQNGDGNILESGSVGAGNYFNGLLGELLFYNIALDANQTDLLNNFLMAKYGVTPTANDIYAYDTNVEGDFDFNLLGVRQTPATTINETTYSTGIIRFSNPTALGSGDAIIAASDVQDQTLLDASLANCASTLADDLRLDATWRVDVQGTPGSIDIELDYNSLQIGGNTNTNLDLLIDDNPNFTSPTRISPTDFCSTALYLGVSFTNGDYFTFERTGIAPVTWDGSNWANGSGVSNDPTIADQFKKLIVSGPTGVLSQDAGCSCLIVEPTGALDSSGFNLNVKANIQNNGSFDISSAELAFTGNANQSITGNGFTAADVLLDNQNQLTLSFNPSEVLELRNVLNVPNGVLNTNGALSIFSDASDTGQIDELTGTNDINGDVIIERFIPARRAFRLVSSSVTTSGSIKDNWQEGLNNTGTNFPADNNPGTLGLGTHITGSQTGANGFDATPSGNPSLFTFSNDNSQQWNAVANTNTNTLTAGDAYRILIRGDRSINVTSNSAGITDTKLRSTGPIAKGPITYNPSINSGQFAMLGNPFQSIVDMDAVLTGSGFTGFFTIWDPTLGGTPTVGSPGGRGAYVTVNASAGSYNYTFRRSFWYHIYGRISSTLSSLFC